ncbi:Ig-like domain-containing protein [Zongyangia hominis]|uniref:Ig domain-containing protein n=1 Tax=Zongyangia hominis TaxID=2763677 RepID=A0A926EA81_9FIRM|nr:Ig-like domain-containing protein [Zongyangia hominis]MBC8570172.1 Ig domain-containing protein [Zongyangia hominis]
MKKWLILLCSFCLLLFSTGCQKEQAAPQKIIALDALSLGLGPGEEDILTASPNPETDAGLQWSSSDLNVVVVDHGELRAVQPGTARVSVSCEGYATAVCEVKVRHVQTQEIRVENPRIVMALGDKISPTILFIPEEATDREVTWRSHNQAVVAVDEKGRLVGKTIGKTSVSATSSNGKETVCEVEVRKLPLGLKLDRGAVSMQQGESIQLTAKPSSGTVEDAAIHWSSDNESVVTVHKGKIIATGLGAATVKANTINGKIAECHVLVRPDPITYRGSGDKTIEHVSVPAGCYAVRMEHEGKGYFGVTAFDDKGNEELWCNSSVSVSYAPLFSGKTDGVHDARIVVEADAGWTISFEPLMVYGGLNWEGKGSGATGIFPGTNQDVRIFCHGILTAWLLDDTGKMTKLTDPSDSPVSYHLDHGRYYYIVAVTRGEWRVEMQTSDQNGPIVDFTQIPDRTEK